MPKHSGGKAHIGGRSQRGGNIFTAIKRKTSHNQCLLI